MIWEKGVTLHTYVSAETEFPVEFYDVDSMMIVWHGNYIKYFEKARCALLKKIDFSYIDMKNSGWMFPVTSVSAKYIASFNFGDHVRAKAMLVEYENCMKIKYELYNAKTGRLCTRGESTQMAVEEASGEAHIVCPAVFTGKVEALLHGEGKNDK
ncbi:MAG: acyl-CoA thioesterase [Treponema sp.]|nr:acyl-CoA thioesterase [Treponema sp.]